MYVCVYVCMYVILVKHHNWMSPIYLIMCSDFGRWIQLIHFKLSVVSHARTAILWHAVPCQSLNAPAGSMEELRGWHLLIATSMCRSWFSQIFLPLCPGPRTGWEGSQHKDSFARRNSSWKWVPTQSENLQDRSRKALVGSNLVLSHTSTGVMPLLPFYLLQKPLRQTNVLTCVGAFIYQLPQEWHLAEVHDQEEEDEGADLAPRETLGGRMGRFGVQLSLKAEFCRTNFKSRLGWIARFLGP